MKLWEKGYELHKTIEKFTIGEDYILDKKLVKYDCIASIAHATMLNSINILSDKELADLTEGLNQIINLDSENKFIIDKTDEDCHTAIENFLVKNYGEAGKKIHTARSRNDQVLTAIRLYEKNELKNIENIIVEYNNTLNEIIQKFGNIQLPGYTHMQRAMPSNVGMMFSSFVDSSFDNLKLLKSIGNIIDQSPLGSAAGFGVPVLKIDKNMTSQLMGFDKVMQNPMYSQLSRGKFEASIIHVCSQIMFDLNKLATDLTLFCMQEFKFITLSDSCCTGSSIMPHKKNPDVLELIRASYHVILGEEFKTKSMIANLISGYNRDLQLTKKPLFTCIDITKESLEIVCIVLNGLSFNKDNCKLTEELFTTEKAYKLVEDGIPFRDAYLTIANKHNK